MSKNFKKALAFGSSVALGAAGLIGVSTPAYAVGEVTIAPTSGTRYAVFNTDEFKLTTTVLTQSVSANTLSYALTDEDQGKWWVKVGNITSATTGVTAETNFTFAARDELGANIDMDRTTNDAQGTIALAAISDGANPDFDEAETELHGQFLVDFSKLGPNGATTLYISTIAIAGASNLLTIEPYEGDVTATGDAPTGSIQILSGNDVVANSNPLDWGDGDVAMTVQSWIDLDSDIDDIESNYASAAQTINWFDPKGVAVIPSVERFVDSAGTAYLNDASANGNLAATISFGKAVNLDQIDITNWEYKIGESSDSGFDNISGNDATEPFVRADDLKLAASFTNNDGAGKLHAVLTTSANAAITLAVNKDYIVSVKNTDASGIWYGSVAYVPASNTAAADQIEAAVTSTTDAIQTNAADPSVQLRTGSKAFTYKAQIKTDDATVAKTPSIQVLAIVTSGAYLATGGGYQVSGATQAITRAGQAVITTGFTDSNGNYSVTVTSTNAATAESYVVKFYVLDGATDTWLNLNNANGGAADDLATYTATYESGTASILTPESSVVSGADVTAAFTVTDQFGVATNLRGTRAVSVELKSSNGTTLDLDAPVAANGTVSFTFKNYVVAGASDVLTATTYVGTATSPTPLTGALVKTIQLYNPAAASAVQVPATLTGVITYDDFITGKATAAAPAPNDGTMTLTGTVVDANGSGVPAAVVTLEAAGFQFQNVGSTTYAKDKITVTASAAGVFNVNFWAQKVTGSTGTPLKVTTSDGKTATTSVRTYLPKGLDGNNLKFELTMPSNVVVNTTYAVTAKLTDKWGNPVATTGTTVAVQGFGSVQINSTDNVTNRAFGRDGTSVVFLRSVKDIAGPGSVTAALQTGATYTAYDNVTDDGDAASNALEATTLTIAEIATDVATTAWDETKFTNSLSANVEVLQSAPAGAGKVNVGSFNGKLVVYASGLNGARISWKVGGNWGSAVATSNYSIFNRPTPRAGVTVSVDIYVNGVKTLTKSVLTR